MDDVQGHCETRYDDHFSERKSFAELGRIIVEKSLAGKNHVDIPAGQSEQDFINSCGQTSVNTFLLCYIAQKLLEHIDDDKSEFLLSLDNKEK